MPPCARVSTLWGNLGVRGAAEVEQIDHFGYGLRVCRDRLISAQKWCQKTTSLRGGEPLVQALRHQTKHVCRAQRGQCGEQQNTAPEIEADYGFKAQ
jgi:hypothetical protein